MTNSNKAVFLSYASQDAEAAHKICEALRAAGVEVWFDQSELVGGDAWDQKIRKQIKECALFVPVISANTQARREGYFRLEWKLADDRTHLMARGTPFIVPLCVDATKDWEAVVPDSFMTVQWTRLPGGETTPAFGERVKKLLGGGDPVGAALRRDSFEPSRREAVPTRRSARSWSLAAVIALAVIVALAIWQPWKSAQPASPASAGKSVFPAPVTEAQKLVAQARKIYDEGDELNRENLFLAEDLVKRALALDPAEPTAWELGAWLSYTMAWHLIDNTEGRHETVLRQAARARALAPQLVSAQVVHANARMVGSWFKAGAAGQNEMREVERELAELARREPGNWQVHRALGSVYRFLDRPEESISALRRAVELSGGNPAASGDLANVLLRRNRMQEAEDVVTAALARGRNGRLLTFDLILRSRWRGDVAGAQQALATWPAWLLLEDRGAFLAWHALFLGRKTAEAALVVRRLPRDYLRDVNFAGPRAVLTARAHEFAGNAEAARADWRVAEQVADRELAGSPDDPAALYWKAWALARLGETARAQAICTLLRQRSGSHHNVFFKGSSLAALLITAGMKDSGLAELRTELGESSDSYTLTRAVLEFDPAFDPVRADPQFTELLQQAPAPAPPTASAAAADAKSIAVLAFKNRSDDAANEYFSDGISEELINVLGRVPGLTVKGRSSSFYFKDKDATAQEKGRKLGVAYLVDGSVRKVGNTVRITAQLIRAMNDEVVWSSEPLTRELKDVLALQEEIAGLIAQNLQLKLGAAAQPVKSVHPEAHRLVLEGRHYLALRGEPNFARSDRGFRRAAEIAPNFAVIYEGWTELAAQRRRYQLLAGEDVGALQLQEVQAHAARALELDPSLAGPHAALAAAYIDAGRLDEAEAAAARGFKANPNYAALHLWMTQIHAARGRLDLALQTAGKGTELDPLSFAALFIRGAHLHYAGRHAEALLQLDRAAELRAQRFLPLEAERAVVRMVLRRHDEALVIARQILDDPDLLANGWWSVGDALWVLRQGGAKEEAARRGETLLVHLGERNYLRGYVLCALGRNAEGLPWLKPASTIARTRVLFAPALSEAREHPGFGALLREWKCAAEYEQGKATVARLQAGTTP